MGERAMLAVAVVVLAAACSPVVEHRDFVPNMPGMIVDLPGDRDVDAVLHVIPPNAVDERSAVLVYSGGADAIDESYGSLRAAELRMHFRARNDEPVPLIVEPQNALLVVAPESGTPAVVTPTWIEADDNERTTDDGSIVIAPKSTASWGIVFTLPARRDPLKRVRSFLVSWTYQLGPTAFEERTRFLAAKRPDNDWGAARAYSRISY